MLYTSIISSPNPNVPVLIGSIYIPVAEITFADFKGVVSEIVDEVVNEVSKQHLKITIPENSENWGYFSQFDWISASFTHGEDDNVISDRVVQCVPSNGDLIWYIYSVDNSLFLVGDGQGSNPDVGGVEGYDRVTTSIVFFGHKNILG